MQTIKIVACTLELLVSKDIPASLTFWGRLGPGFVSVVATILENPLGAKWSRSEICRGQRIVRDWAKPCPAKLGILGSFSEQEIHRSPEAVFSRTCHSFMSGVYIRAWTSLFIADN